ncbi:MAG: hypothetical protein JSR76_00285 [Verrucomicrobia bacterium]|nr:hypothetical protein [Verrucomicrobiota bacterium]
MAGPVSGASTVDPAFMASIQASHDILAARKAARQGSRDPAVSAPPPALTPFRFVPNGRTYKSVMDQDLAHREACQARLAGAVMDCFREAFYA